MWTRPISIAAVRKRLEYLRGEVARLRVLERAALATAMGMHPAAYGGWRQWPRPDRWRGHARAEPSGADNREMAAPVPSCCKRASHG